MTGGKQGCGKVPVPSVIMWGRVALSHVPIGPDREDRASAPDSGGSAVGRRDARGHAQRDNGAELRAVSVATVTA